MNCPCCGQHVEQPTGLDAALPTLSPLMQRIVRIVARRPGITAREIADVIYSEYASGGPLDARGVINTLIFRQRRKLEAHGWTIKGRHGRGNGYSLLRIE